MSTSVLSMSMSLDGYIADAGDFLGGEDGERLHHWYNPGGAELSGPAKELVDEAFSTGAVLTGRRTAELMDHWGGDLHGAPIFVPSHRPPGPAARWSYPKVTYVTDGVTSDGTGEGRGRRPERLCPRRGVADVFSTSCLPRSNWRSCG